MPVRMAGTGGRQLQASAPAQFTDLPVINAQYSTEYIQDALCESLFDYGCGVFGALFLPLNLLPCKLHVIWQCSGLPAHMAFRAQTKLSGIKRLRLSCMVASGILRARSDCNSTECRISIPIVGIICEAAMKSPQCSCWLVCIQAACISGQMQQTNPSDLV